MCYTFTPRGARKVYTSLTANMWLKCWAMMLPWLRCHEKIFSSIIILWDHCHTCTPLLSKTLLCDARFYKHIFRYLDVPKELKAETLERTCFQEVGSWLRAGEGKGRGSQCCFSPKALSFSFQMWKSSFDPKVMAILNTLASYFFSGC
jgi:hypothetical protein